MIGKTATAEALVQAYPDVPIAIVTYSKRLQMETQHRLAAYPNVDVYTFHGLAGRLSDRVVLNDSLLRDLRRERALPAYPNIPPYAYVVLDELQDLSEDLHWVTEVFLSVITEMAGRAPQVLALGDARQAIYEFRGADARFLDLSPQVFSASPYEWEASELSRSFRLTAETAAFVNHAFLGGQQYITGVREGGPVPLYVQADLKDVPKLLDLLLPLIEKYGPENCAILSPSVRTNPFLSPLTNALSEHYDIPIAVSTSDEVPLDPDVVRGKLVVSTYHQFKGSERDLTIVYGVESSYFRAFARNLPDDTCPNATFVALTRARQQVGCSHATPMIHFR
jgi:superfamily I DNA/RNA helicase